VSSKTPAVSIETPIYIKDSLVTEELMIISKDVGTHREAEWDYYEYTTLKHVPAENTSFESYFDRIREKIDEWSDYSKKLISKGVDEIRLYVTGVSGIKVSTRDVQVTLLVVILLLISTVFIIMLAGKPTNKQRTLVQTSVTAKVKKDTLVTQKNKPVVTNPAATNPAVAKPAAAPEKNQRDTNVIAARSPEKTHQSETLVTEKPKAVAVPAKPVVTPRPKKSTAAEMPVKTVKKSVTQPAKVQKDTKPKEIEQPPLEAPVVAAVEKNLNLPGLLKITVNPPDARVFIDGTLLSKNEIRSGTTLIPGNYSITADATGFQSLSQTVIVESDKTVILSLVLKSSEKGNGQLHVYSYPWANLFIDDELVGTTPTPSPLLLAEGTHTVILKRDGYRMYQQEVTVKSGDVIRLKAELKKE
jgi:hypothetical protein